VEIFNNQIPRFLPANRKVDTQNKSSQQLLNCDSSISICRTAGVDADWKEAWPVQSRR